MKINHKRFFDEYRELFDGVKQSQVAPLEFLLGKFEQDARWSDLRHIAYAFATVAWETAWSYQPVEEGYYLGTAARVKAFQKKLRYYPFFGRGYVQLTWDYNYEKLGKLVGVDLKNEPHKALDPETSFEILTLGMHKGLFTGQKLSDHINSRKTDYVEARGIINGEDKEVAISKIAEKFQTVLENSRVNSDAVKEITVFKDIETKAAARVFGEPIAVKPALPSLEESLHLGEAVNKANDAARQAADELVERTKEKAASVFESAKNTAESAANQTADAIVNVGTQADGVIAAARKLEDTVITQNAPLNFLNKLWKYGAGIFAGTILIPEFIQSWLTNHFDAVRFFDLIKFAFPYVLTAAVGGLCVWYVTKKWSEYAERKLIVDTNANPEKGNVRIEPAAPEQKSGMTRFLGL